MGILLVLNFLLVIVGFVVPIPAAILAWRQWARQRSLPPSRLWHRKFSNVAMILVSLGCIFWSYALVRQVQGNYSYIESSAVIGRWVSLGLIFASSFTEGKLRRYLLLASAGIFFFFLCTIGDWTI
jgi:hypothetical protein